MYKNIQMVLKSGDGPTNKDKTTFTKWNNREITTNECFEEFCKNNEVENPNTILKTEFESWLNILGYKR